VALKDAGLRCLISSRLQKANFPFLQIMDLKMFSFRVSCLLQFFIAPLLVRSVEGTKKV
jgi:hypothetical protein